MGLPRWISAEAGKEAQVKPLAAGIARARAIGRQRGGDLRALYREKGVFRCRRTPSGSRGGSDT